MKIAQHQLPVQAPKRRPAGSQPVAAQAVASLRPAQQRARLAALCALCLRQRPAPAFRSL